MPLQPINYGAADNDGTGDNLREAMRKSQANFEYLDQSKADAQATTQAIAQKADAQATAQALEGKVTAEAGKSLMTDTERQKLEGIASGAQVNVATNLALGAATANAREITSSTGGSVTLPAATSSTAGLMTAAESTKLGTVATNASANSSDAFLLNRANHSGTQPLSTITGVGTAAAMNVLGVGGVIERGSNANGEYVKFADGTMIVTKAVQGYSAGVNYFDMAAVFASTPKCFCSIEPNQSWAKELGIYGSNQTWGVNFSAGDNNKILLTAIGVWKL